MFKPILSLFFAFLLPVVCAVASPNEDGGRAFYELGVFAFEDGDYGDAEANFQKARSFAPENPYYNHYLGKTCMKTERYPEAAKYLDMAMNANPEIPGLKYDRAMLRYKMSDFSRAADDFAAISQDNPNNISALFYAGMSRFQIRRYAEARGYFDSAAGKNPAIKPAAWFYSGICDAKTGAGHSAIGRFEFVRDNADSETMRNNAQRWLDVLERAGKPAKAYSLYLSAGAEYDSNVRLEPLDEDVYSDEDDFLAKVYLSGSYNFVNHTDFKFGAGYSHYQTWHNDLTEYDLMGAIGNVFARKSFGDVSFGLSWFPSYYSLDGEDYLVRHQIRPDITWKPDPDAFVAFSYMWSENDYEIDKNDGHTHEAMVDFYYAFGDPGEYVVWGAGYEENTSDNKEKEYAQLETKLDAAFKLPLEFYLGLTAKYTNRQYDYRHPNAASEFHRKDIKYFGAVSLSHSLFFDWLDVVCEGAFTRNDSNVRDYDYQKYAGTLSLEARF